MDFNGNQVKLTQTTNYPWDGKITLAVSPAKSAEFGIALRIPGWVANEAVPTDLYRFVKTKTLPFTITINGKPVKYVQKNGYAVVKKKWKSGDKIMLTLPMPIRKVKANPLVEADRNRIALQRGPLVYCNEWPDNLNGHVLNLVLDSGAVLKSIFKPDLLGGVEIITGDAKVAARTDNGVETKTNQPFTAIPYYAWANRGAGEMQVWIASEASAARPVPKPTLANTSKITASSFKRSIYSINDLDIPATSNDQSLLYYHWWPAKDRTEWIEYDFKKRSIVSSCSVFWFDDAPWGGCRIPANWKILYKSGGTWLQVEVKGDYPNQKDFLNTVKFTPVETDALRLEVTLPQEFSSGIYEWIVE
jgi:hypothetical protein